MRSQTEALACQLGLGWHRRAPRRCHSGRRVLQPASSTAENRLSGTQQRTIGPGTQKRSQPHSDRVLAARKVKHPAIKSLVQAFCYQIGPSLRTPILATLTIGEREGAGESGTSAQSVPFRPSPFVEGTSAGFSGMGSTGFCSAASCSKAASSSWNRSIESGSFALAGCAHLLTWSTWQRLLRAGWTTRRVPPSFQHCAVT